LNLESLAIIEAIRGGSERTLIKLYESYRDEFVSWAIRNHQIATEEAKDIFQETIIAFYRNTKSDESFQINTSIKTYLFAIGNNKILNLIKRRTIEQKYMEDLPSPDYNPIENHYDKDHLAVLVKRIYNNIEKTCREILKMHYEHRFDMESIAERMGYKNANVAKKKKYECLKALEERISMSNLSKNIN
jgi:RNA polymerase sigma factor (sigma-70 family)